jgi:hypothetical protein
MLLPPWSITGRIPLSPEKKRKENEVVTQERDESGKTGKCALCGRQYENWGNNPDPVLKNKGARVCDDCNLRVVIPARLFAIREGK